MCNEKLALFDALLVLMLVLIRNPSLIRDNLPVELLRKVCCRGWRMRKSCFSPRGYCGTNRFWVEFLHRNVANVADLQQRLCLTTGRMMINSLMNQKGSVMLRIVLSNFQFGMKSIWNEFIEHLLSRVSDKTKEHDLQRKETFFKLSNGNVAWRIVGDLILCLQLRRWSVPLDFGLGSPVPPLGLYLVESLGSYGSLEALSGWTLYSMSCGGVLGFMWLNGFFLIGLDLIDKSTGFLAFLLGAGIKSPFSVGPRTSRWSTG